MRIQPRIAVLSLALALGACASTPVKTETPVADVVPGANQYGDYLAARFAVGQHNFDDAARYYRAALASDPGDKDLLELSFFFSASAGDMDEAVVLAKRMIDAKDDNSMARLTLAVAAMKRHDFKEARQEIGLSSKGAYASLVVSLMDAWAAAGAGDKAAALGDLGRIRAQGGADGFAIFHLALAADYLGDRELAETTYQTAIKTAPTPRVIEAYGRFLERQGRKSDATGLYQSALNDTATREIATAGLARLKSGRKPEPLIVHAEDGAAEALFGIAASLNDQASTDVSILYLRLAMYLRPTLDLGAVLLADRFEHVQKYEDAIAAYKTVDKSSPYWRLAAIESALDEARLKRSDEAIAQLKALTDAMPDDVEAWTALGDTYRNADKNAAAIDAYSRAITLSGADAEWSLYFSRAVAEQGTKDWSASEDDLKAALKLAPNEPMLLNYLGYTWVDQDRNIPEALKMLERAHALKPMDGYIADSVGWAYYKLGRYKEASDALQTAVELVPGDPTINDHYGDALWRVGRKRDAQFQWYHALAFGPDDADKAIIEKKLKDGL